ncbi:MAG: peptidylprolyl isomerase [Ignavibacteria bacterium]|jgi:peptidyl-prolyl cis-trans isomerase SurA
MIIRLTIFLAAVVMFYSCSSDISKTVVAEYGNRYVTLDEFEKAYSKSVGGVEQATQSTLDDYKNFLDLYLNFKMKLRNAEVRGLSADEEIIDEYNTYKSNVGKSFIIEKEINIPGKKELYEKRKYEMRVSHIMIRPDSSGEEGAKKKAEELLEKINTGESFEELAKQHSQDFYSSKKGGDIYYIQVGQTVPSFDFAAYDCEVGKVYPEVVKTRFGYHIIKVTEKKPVRHQIKASHILCRIMNDEDQLDTAASKKKIEEVLGKIADGEDFSKLAEEYSDDNSNKDKGGDLGFFGRRRMVLKFDEVAFNTKVGEISESVKTRFGYHIIKVTDEKPYPTFEEEKSNIDKLFKEKFYNLKYQEFVDSLKKDYKCSLNESAIKFISENNDSAKFNDGYWNDELSELVKDTVVLTVAGKSYFMDDIVSELKDDSKFKNNFINENILKRASEQFSDDMLIDKKVDDLEKTDSSFKNLMDEYKNGIYIFKIQEEEVWNKIKLDSVKIYKYWEENKEKYTWNDRVNFSEIFTRKDSVINKYYALLQAGEPFDSVAAKYTQRKNYKKTAGRYNTMEVGSNELAKKANALEKPGDYSEPFEVSGGWSIVKLNEKIPVCIKTFEEAQPQVTGELQEAESKKFEEEYLDKLNEIYKPTQKYEELSKAFKGEKE